MEQIAQLETPEKWGRDIAPYRLLRYWFVVFIMWLGFTVIIMSVRTLALTVGEPSNPFSAYANLFPGQSTSNVEMSKFTCALPDADDRLIEEHCALKLLTGTFSEVGIITFGGIVRQISFIMREETLRVGDLMLLWGTPEVQKYSRSVYLFWQNRSVFALARRDNRLSSLSLPVLRVYFFNVATENETDVPSNVTVRARQVSLVMCNVRTITARASAGRALNHRRVPGMERKLYRRSRTQASII